MVKLNGAEYAFQPDMSLKDLIDKHNTERNKVLGFDGFIIIINNTALTEAQARERALQDNDTINILPMIDGG